MSRNIVKTTILSAAIVIGATFSLSAQTAVARHGKLKTYKGYLMDEHDKIVQLRGMSFYWSKWEGPAFYTTDMVKTMVDTWKCTVLRVAYANGSEGWNSCQTVIDAAIQKGIYVIIDWHSHNAHEQASAAISFFTEKAKQYMNTPNVIFEPFNEPITSDGTTNGDLTTANATWKVIKPYLTNVTKAIRETGSKNLIILGTPYYSQFVQIVANSQVLQSNGQPFENVAYAFHFYAASHGLNAYYVKNDPSGKGGEEGSFLRDALGKIPIFITEWGTSHSNGGQDGKDYVDEANTNWWFDTYINGEYHISHCNWSICDIQSSSAFNGGGAPNSLRPSGVIAKRLISSPTTDSYDPPWILGQEGPAKDSVFTMPGTHACVGYNKYFGANFQTGTVLYAEYDKVDVREAKNKAIIVTSTPGTEWVSYSINSTSATKNLMVRYLAPDGTGTIDVALDGTKVGTLTLSKTAAKTWTNVMIPCAVSSGKHSLTFTFTGVTGSGYKIEWFELTNKTTGVIAGVPLDSYSNVKIFTATSTLSLQLPVSHEYVSYSIAGVNGRVARQGALSKDISSIKVSNLSTGTWFLKLKSTRRDLSYRVVIGNN